MTSKQIYFLLSDGFSLSLEDNFQLLMDLLDQAPPATSVVKTIPWLLWSIWKNRNAILFAATQESPSRIVQLAEEEAHLSLMLGLHGIAMVSVRDLHFENVSIASDHKDTIAAISSPNQWPRYRYLLEEIKELAQSFSMVVFEEEQVSTNSIARDIAKSVLRFGQFQSYLALGGPAWLHERLYREAALNQ
ncbi:BnaUnng04080D [Brassica napus]|uniref:BnaCnng39120D protein n=2 Tax=Brassica TaxID=3705 RepID=A0A078JWX1_BRANA|nr:BnaCnng39120D [Brassica napus]CDY70905.1 BnaUnng04080D [Brassica napus]